MARRTVVTFLDDLDGSDDGTVETVKFSIDGNDYEIDLSENSRIGFYDALAPYILKARRVQPSTKRAPRSGPSDASAIRAWAVANGVQVTERGRISASVREQYQKANQ